MTVYLYNRVSTNNQDSSTQQQEQLLIQFCQRKGFEEYQMLTDTDVSGSKAILDRPMGSKLSEVKKGDIIICAKHDRMYRSLKDAVNTVSEWFELGVSIYFLNLGETPIDMKTPHTKFMLYMMMATAELEKDTISERTIKNLRFRKDNGKVYSAAIYGWDIIGERNNRGKLVNGQRVINEAEQIIVKEIFELYSKEPNLNKIARTLNIRQIKSKKGGRWYAKTVQDVIENDINTQYNQ
jgi:DNA invertase Pin-like site-specific DNA recombinase